MEIDSTSIRLSQDGDSLGGDDVQVLDLETGSADGGHFWIIRTERWAVADMEDFISHLRKIADTIHPLTIDTALDNLNAGDE